MNKNDIKLYLQLGIVFQMFVTYLRSPKPDFFTAFILLVGLFLVVLLALPDKPQ